MYMQRSVLVPPFELAPSKRKMLDIYDVDDIYFKFHIIFFLRCITSRKILVGHET